MVDKRSLPEKSPAAVGRLPPIPEFAKDSSGLTTHMNQGDGSMEESEKTKPSWFALPKGEE
jgi:hypothetical protein